MTKEQTHNIRSNRFNGESIQLTDEEAKKHDELITRITELAGIARKDGMMALEGQEVPDKFWAKGMQMLVDGADEKKLTSQMQTEIGAMKTRHEAMQGVVGAWIDIAPAMGMIGTLVGLVLMLDSMVDLN